MVDIKTGMKFSDVPFFRLGWDECRDLLDNLNHRNFTDELDRPPFIHKISPNESSTSNTSFAIQQLGNVVETAELSPLQIFFLKWRLFSRLCSNVRDFHNQTQQPYLNLQPLQIQVHVPWLEDSNDPLSWTLNVKLVEPNMKVERSEDWAEETDHAFNISTSEFHPLYVTPEVRTLKRKTLKSLRPSKISIVKTEEKSFEPIASLHGKAQIYFSHKDVGTLSLKKGDSFRIILCPTEIGEHGHLTIWCRLFERSKEEWVFHGFWKSLPNSAWEFFEKVTPDQVEPIKFEVFEKLHLGYDLFSLAMLLIRLIWTPSDQQLKGVQERLEQVTKNHADLLNQSSMASHDKLWDRYEDWLSQIATSFGSDFLGIDSPRGEEIESTLPRELLDTTRLLVLRLVTKVPEFSFWTHQGENDFSQANEVMEEVNKEVARIGEGIRVELFDWSRRNQEIQEACELLREELTQGLLSQ